VISIPIEKEKGRKVKKNDFQMKFKVERHFVAGACRHISIDPLDIKIELVPYIFCYRQEKQRIYSRQNKPT
jgi:hypothetical protein